jgi:hypothetical protein
MRIKKVHEANLAMLRFVADKLGDLREEVVFLGGCATAVLVSDPGAPDVRRTLDVDCIVDVISLSDYNKLAKKLRQKGFTQSISDSVICRWRIGEFILDVMPTNEKILGFGNAWYPDAIKNAQRIDLGDFLQVLIVTAPYFLATKMEAFKARGNNDFLASHDFEDIICLLDGRPEIFDEISSSDSILIEYLAANFSNFIKKNQFLDALPGHLNYGALVDDRVNLVMDRISKIIDKAQ